MLGGDTLFYVFISIIVSCFTCATLIIDLYYEVIHDICLLFFLFCEIKNFILFYLYFSRGRLCVCRVLQEYTGLFSRTAVYTSN